ncbi:MAG: 4Fe-4S ferredoxin [Butyricicoccus sp.]|nr:4Fe-4S ferredoxin [Butyricicoccus sp.]MBQ8584657.1 4Fe-4S ferredoxin [Butyricicoccus sp.]
MAKNWYPVVDETLCVQCGRCIKLCAGNKHFCYDVDRAPVPVVVQPENCVDHCHGCGTLCPQGAITYFGEDTKWTPPHRK